MSGEAAAAFNDDIARVGGLIANKYRVERILGEGGFGVVLAATHIDLHERVAVKLLRANHRVSEELVERFLREARALRRLTSKHAVKIDDVGRLPSGLPYLAMELLCGEDLDELVEREGPLPAGQAVRYVLQALDAVAEAHALGIVHRDLKPANLFLAREDNGEHVVKVLDFGISKFTADADAGSITTTAAMLGSPLFMSPEQAMSTRDTDVRSDVWSMGVVLYKLLTGQTPFDGDTIMAICMKLVQTEPEPPSVHQPELPAGLVDVIMRCLEKDREDRYANATELAQALEPFAGIHDARAVVVKDRVIVSRAVVGAASTIRAVPTQEAQSDQTPASDRPSEADGAPPPTVAPRGVLTVSMDLGLPERVGTAGASSLADASLDVPPSADPLRSRRKRAWALSAAVAVLAVAGAATLYSAAFDQGVADQREDQAGVATTAAATSQPAAPALDTPADTPAAAAATTSATAVPIRPAPVPAPSPVAAGRSAVPPLRSPSVPVASAPAGAASERAAPAVPKPTASGSDDPTRLFGPGI